MYLGRKRGLSRTQMESRNKLKSRNISRSFSKKGATSRHSCIRSCCSCTLVVLRTRESRVLPRNRLQVLAVFSKSGKKRDTKMVAKQVAAERGNYRFVKSFNKAIRHPSPNRRVLVNQTNQSHRHQRRIGYTRRKHRSHPESEKDVGAIERKGLLIF